jgi:aspartate/methionine/tyrosine aminotransferase
LKAEISDIGRVIASMTGAQHAAIADRLLRTHLPERATVLGMSVREADVQLRLDGAGHGLMDTTHFDTVRFPPPDWALQAFTAAACDGTAAYTAYRGSSDVLRSCADSVSGLLGIELDPSRNLALTTGTQGALFATLSALINEGDVVALTDPEYLFVERMLRFLGAQVLRVGLVDGPDGPQVNLAELEGLARQGIRLFMTSNPHNPTGAVFTAETLHGVAALAVEHDFAVFVDELYCRLVYGSAPFTHIAALPGMAERTITSLGGSKTESLSGYRIGLVVAPAEIIDAVEQVLAICCLRAPAYSQHVLAHWLVDDHDFVARRVEELHALQAMTVSALRTVPGLTVTAGAGTAYVWPDVSALGLTDVEIAKTLQTRAGVVISPGYQFGPSGIGHFRTCYARDEAEWERALDGIVATLTAAHGNEGSR